MTTYPHRPRGLNSSRLSVIGLVGAIALWVTPTVGVAADAPEGWKTGAPREEISPQFSYDPFGGPDGKGAFIIQADRREGLHGYWMKTFPVTGGRHYRFQAFRKVQNVAIPRRSAVVRLLWSDDQGKPVPNDNRTITDAYRGGGTAIARAEHPTDKQTDDRGWTEVSDAYLAPTKATQVTVELNLLWAPGGKIEWGGVSLDQTPAPAGRRVRLATVHFKPKGGKTPAGNCRLFGGPARDADHLRHGPEVHRRGRAGARPIHGVLRPTGPKA